MKKQILVTGGAGYIGSHAVVELLDNGYDVVVIDSLENGNRHFVDNRAKFYKGNVRDENIMSRIFEENDIFVVMHFAGYIKVEESIIFPEKYYENNTYTTLLLLNYMKKFDVQNIIFSSTAAVYGEITTNEPVKEENLTNPINPYGRSKLMSENIIIDFAKAYNFNYSIFRYFNVAGAHEKYKIGQTENGATALVTLVLKVIQEKKILKIFGNDYNTIDGTGARDYIHVIDLVRAHILAIKELEKNRSNIFNLGNGRSFSVLEIIKAAEIVTARKVKYQIKARREGDPASVIASSEKAKEILKWEPKYKDVKDIIYSAWKYLNKK